MSAPAHSRLRRLFGRAGAVLLALLIVATVSGAVYEMRARNRAASEFPPPGKLIEIGGRRIHLDCRGSGTPTVILESGLDSYGSLSWSAVQDPIAQFTRTCSYDRAGMMWSDGSSGATDAAAIATDLHHALDAAGEEQPYVIVGHSLGGPYALMFTKQFGAEVQGLVLVDSSHPDQQQKMKAATGKQIEPPGMVPKVLAALAWTGLPRLIMPARGHSTAPERANQAMAAYMPRSLDATLDELGALDRTLRESAALRDLGDRPLVVLTALWSLSDADLAMLNMARGQSEQMKSMWLALHDDAATWSSHSTHRRIDGTSHYIQFDRPDVVIAAVREVVDAVRAQH